MTFLEAKTELESYVKTSYETKNPTIVWAVVGHTNVAKITKLQGGMLLATFTPKDGLTVFDDVAKYDGKKWDSR